MVELDGRFAPISLGVIGILAVVAILIGSQVQAGRDTQFFVTPTGNSNSSILNTNIPCTYLIFKTTTQYNTENCSTGNVDFRGTDASAVLTSTISALPNQDGVIYVKDNLTLNTAITVSKNITITFNRFGSYYNPNVIWNGSSGNYVFDFKGGKFQTVNLKNLYIDGQNKTGGTGGIHLDGNVSRTSLDNIGMKKMNGKGIVFDGLTVVIGTHIEVYQSCGYGLDATGVAGLTTFEMQDIQTIGNGNCAVGGKTFTVHLKNVQGVISNLIASGATTSAFGGPSLRGIFFDTSINNLFIGTLHVEAITGAGGVSAIAFGGSVGHVGDVKATTIQNIFLYNYNGTVNPIMLTSTQNVYIGAIQVGCPVAVSYQYNVEASYNIADPNNNVNSTIGTISTACALSGPIIDTWKNIKVQTPGNPFIVYNALVKQKSETGADSSLISYVTPGRTATYQTCISMDVSASNTAVLGWKMSWTDSNGNSNTPGNLALFQSGTALPALNFTATAPSHYYACNNIDVSSASNTITVKTTFTGTSIAYKVSAWIMRIQ